MGPREAGRAGRSTRDEGRARHLVLQRPRALQHRRTCSPGTDVSSAPAVARSRRWAGPAAGTGAGATDDWPLPSSVLVTGSTSVFFWVAR